MSALTDDEKNRMIAALRAEGYFVTLPALEREQTIADLRKTTGMTSAALHKRMQHRDCPPWKATLCGPTGRVMRVRVSAEAMRFLSRPPSPGKASAARKQTETLCRDLSTSSLATT
jgi:hypothetical protein